MLCTWRKVANALCCLFAGAAPAEGAVYPDSGGKDPAYGHEGEGPCGAEGGCEYPQVVTRYPCTNCRCATARSVHDLCWPHVPFANEAHEQFGIQRRCSVRCLLHALQDVAPRNEEGPEQLRQRWRELEQRCREFEENRRDVVTVGDEAKKNKRQKRQPSTGRSEVPPTSGEWRTTTWTRLGRDGSLRQRPVSAETGH